VEGIFRLSGSARRIGELQHLFDIPPLYGSQLDWQGYSIHDAANVLRRFLNSLPDPVITHKSYNDFRNVLGKYRAWARIGDWLVFFLTRDFRRARWK
jgi:hypothetical protein